MDVPRETLILDTDCSLANGIVSDDAINRTVRKFCPYKAGGQDEIVTKNFQVGLNTLPSLKVGVLRASDTLGKKNK